MLVDFAEIHKTFLVPRQTEHGWVYAASNAESPKKGFFPSTHQIFSNHALQIAIYIYNNSSNAGRCDSVSHCLYLNFTRKAIGKYLLNNDPDRVTFNLDVGIAMSLYRFVVGLSDVFTYSAIRSGKAPKQLKGYADYCDGERSLVLVAETVKDGQASRVEVELSNASRIAIAAHAIGYGKLLYPALADTVIQGMFSTPDLARPASTCVERDASGDEQGESTEHSKSRACAENSARPAVDPRQKLTRVVWAIGNQKWPRMRIDALKKIQTIDDLQTLQSLVDEANRGDFTNWDAYL